MSLFKQSCHLALRRFGKQKRFPSVEPVRRRILLQPPVFLVCRLSHSLYIAFMHVLTTSKVDRNFSSAQTSTLHTMSADTQKLRYVDVRVHSPRF
jgi:cell division protein FtsB